MDVIVSRAAALVWWLSRRPVIKRFLVRFPLRVKFLVSLYARRKTSLEVRSRGLLLCVMINTPDDMSSNLDRLQSLMVGRKANNQTKNTVNVTNSFLCFSREFVEPSQNRFNPFHIFWSNINCFTRWDKLLFTTRRQCYKTPLFCITEIFSIFLRI